MKKYYGMTKREWKALANLLNTPASEVPETVAEYIERTGVRTERRTSKKGVDLIKVFYPTGIVKEYEVSRIAAIEANAF